MCSKQAQWWPLGSRGCGSVSQGYTAIRHARQSGLMHILCTFHWSVERVHHPTCMQCAHEHAYVTYQIWSVMPNSSSTWSNFRHHSPYDHDHTPRNEEGTKRHYHHGYVRMDTDSPWHVCAEHVTWWAHVTFLLTQAEVAIDCWRLLLWRDTWCAFPAFQLLPLGSFVSPTP